VTAAQVSAIQPVLLEYEEMQGHNAVRPLGFVRLDWIDEVDASTQFCRAYLPAHYDPARRWPLIVYLHGYNGENPPYVGFWNVDRRHYDVTERYDTILVEVHGRGNVDYRHMGEADVMRCIREAQDRFAVDQDRIYLNGESMGGSGTWTVGSRNAATFAAIAPVFGGWDYRIRPDRGYANPEALSVPERFVSELQASFASAENLMSTPIWIIHGDADAAVPIEHSRHISRMLQRWGYDLRYEEMPGWRHEDLNSRWRITEWLLSHTRGPPPRRVQLRSAELRGARAHWLEVTEYAEPLRPMRASAEVLEPGVVRLDTDNVAAVRLRLPSAYWGQGGINVIWNGESREVPQMTGDGSITLGWTPRAATLHKTPELQGGMGDILRTPYVIVVGTHARDPAMNRALAERGAALANLWHHWQHVYPRLVNDRDLTPEMERSLSLILIGGPAENSVAARLGNRVPLRVQGNAVTIDGRRFDAPDAAAQMLYPSPLAPGRYVLLVAPTSTAGMRFWDPTTFWSWIAGCPCQPLDWAITDARLDLMSPGLGRERLWVASGTFDAGWRRDDRWTFIGDAASRAAVALRGSPPAAPPPGGYAGRYQGNRTAIVTEEGGRLWLDLPTVTDGRVALEPAGPDLFTAPGVASPILFLRDASGRVTALAGHRYDGAFGAGRVP
jgi:poly(3-hydroxybutyrate) depolymerase